MVAGVDDAYDGHDDLDRTLAGRPEGVPTLLLAHYPRFFAEACPARRGAHIERPHARRTVRRAVLRGPLELVERAGAGLAQGFCARAKACSTSTRASGPRVPPCVWVSLRRLRSWCCAPLRGVTCPKPHDSRTETSWLAHHRRGAPVGVGVVTLGSLLMGACGRSSGPQRPPRESLLEKIPRGGRVREPGGMALPPAQRSSLLARHELPTGPVLYAGERGERWLFDRKTNAVRAAARLAPESLIAVLRLADGGWLFVGQSGTGYEAREPLGPFVRTSAPLDKLARVSAAGTSVVGVTRDGALVQSGDAAASFKPVGANDIRYVDVMMADSSRGLALSLPEATWQTKDGGSTWTKPRRAHMGAIGFGWDDKQGVAVQTALSWVPGIRTARPLSRLSAVRPRRRASSSRRGPRAGPMRRRWPRDVPSCSTTSIWRFAREAGASASSRRVGRRSPARMGALAWADGGNARSTPIEAAQGCQSVRLAGFGRWLYFACARAARREPTSHHPPQRGRRKELRGRPLQPRELAPADLALAVGTDGDLIVTGVCAPHSTSRGCLPYGILSPAPRAGGRRDRGRRRQRLQSRQDRRRCGQEGEGEEEGRWCRDSRSRAGAVRGSGVEGVGAHAGVFAGWRYGVRRGASHQGQQPGGVRVTGRRGVLRRPRHRSARRQLRRHAER